jgi:hypothetical protein
VLLSRRSRKLTRMPDPPRVVMRGYGVVSLPICIAQFGSYTKAGIVDIALTTATATATVERVSVAVGLIPIADIRRPRDRRRETGHRPHLLSGVSYPPLDIDLLRDLDGVIDLDAEVAHSAFYLRVTEQKLHGPKVTRPPVDQLGFGTLQ